MTSGGRAHLGPRKLGRKPASLAFACSTGTGLLQQGALLICCVSPGCSPPARLSGQNASSRCLGLYKRMCTHFVQGPARTVPIAATLQHCWMLHTALGRFSRNTSGVVHQALQVDLQWLQFWPEQVLVALLAMEIATLPPPLRPSARQALPPPPPLPPARRPAPLPPPPARRRLPLPPPPPAPLRPPPTAPVETAAVPLSSAKRRYSGERKRSSGSASQKERLQQRVEQRSLAAALSTVVAPLRHSGYAMMRVGLDAALAHPC